MRRIIIRTLGIVALSLAVGSSACAKKEEAAVPLGGPVAVEAAADEAPVTEAAALNADEAAAAPAPAGEAVAVVAAADAPSCAGHAGGESDCPFHEEKAAGNCGHAEVAAAPSGEGKHFGAPFSEGEPTTLAAVIATATPDATSTVKIAGTIHKVCKKKGCWMVVKDGEHEARVIMKDYAFTVPLDSEGKATTIEGELKVRVFTEAQAKHLAEDGGEDPAAVEGERREYLVTASAVEIGT